MLSSFRPPSGPCGSGAVKGIPNSVQTMVVPRSLLATSTESQPTGITQLNYGSASKLDLIEKCAASSRWLGVKDGFVPEDLVGSFEGEPERPEISEGAPASRMSDQ